MLFVFLGYLPGGVWFNYGNRQFVCHCLHMGRELLTLAWTPFPNLNTGPKKGKSVPKKLNTDNQMRERKENEDF